jgi:hypothetical protein
MGERSGAASQKILNEAPLQDQPVYADPIFSELIPDLIRQLTEPRKLRGKGDPEANVGIGAPFPDNWTQPNLWPPQKKLLYEGPGNTPTFNRERERYKPHSERGGPA